MLLLLSICLSVTARVICILCIIIIMWMNPLLFLFLHSAFIPSFFLLLFDDFFNISCLNGLSPWFTSWLRHIKSTWQWRHTHTLKRSLIKMTLRNVAWYYCKHKQHFMPVVDHWLCIIQTLKLNVFIERLELCITKKKCHVLTQISFQSGTCHFLCSSMLMFERVFDLNSIIPLLLLTSARSINVWL